MNKPTASDSITYGIAHFEPTSIATSQYPIIYLNEVTNGRYGIYFSNTYGTTVAGNTLSQTSNDSSTFVHAGIYTSGAKELKIEENNIIGNGTSYDTTTANTRYRKNGILFVNSYGDICSDTFSSIGYAMQFQGDCFQSVGTKLKQNVINASKYGVVLKNIGTNRGRIGDQGDSTLTHGNLFVGPFNNTDCIGDSCRTYTFSSFGNLSPFWVLDTLTAEPKYNGSSTGTDEMKKFKSVSLATPWVCGASKNSAIVDRDSLNKSLIETALDVIIFPNPANSTIEVIISGTDEEQNLEIYNMLGQLVNSIQIHNHTTINVSDFQEGIYILKFTNFQNTQTLRLVISK